jgi:hypothetical protein
MAPGGDNCQGLENDIVSGPDHSHWVTYMSGNNRSARFPVSAAFQAGPVVEPDADYDARSTTWMPRRPARARRTARLAMVAGVLAASVAVAYAFVRSRQSATDGAKPTLTAAASRDHDGGKGAIEDERPSVGTNAPGLDNNGMPNDERAITEDALGARLDGTQG